jgi:hypothetical protein
MVPMDRARQDWVYEHAETGRPCHPIDRARSRGDMVDLVVCTIEGSRWHFRKAIPLFRRAGPPCKPIEPNGRAGQITNTLENRQRSLVGNSGTGGHSLSAIGLPQKRARPALPLWFAVPWAGRHAETVRRAFIRLSAHPFPCRQCAPPSNLAACTGRPPRWATPDGKVRWQRKFAFPARRMRRGLRF